MAFCRQFRKPVAAVLTGTMLLVSMPVLPVQAKMVGTDQVVPEIDQSARDRVDAFMTREDVKAQFRALGISPEEAQARVAALSDAEIDKIAGRLDTLPAGEGAVGAIVGAALIIFIVLLITDLLGWTDVFTFTKKGAANPS